jgi:hypothetical protein
MRVVFFEHFTDDSCRFRIFFPWMKALIMHSVEDSSVDRLEAVTDIRECTRDDD